MGGSQLKGVFVLLGPLAPGVAQLYTIVSTVPVRIHEAKLFSPLLYKGKKKASFSFYFGRYLLLSDDFIIARFIKTFIS